MFSTSPVLAALALSVLGAVPKASDDQPLVYAIVVANNKPIEGPLAPLRYADDDGARFFELLSLSAERVEVLSVLDAPTQQVYPAVAKVARPPNRKELLNTIDSVFRDISAQSAAGKRTIFYFVYVGHGSVGDDGEGVMHLLDGRFSRSDLFQHVVARSPATTNHVIIDACNAYLMVARRGESEELTDESIDNAVAQFLGRESIEKYPNTGVLVSTSQAAEVHEWARFEAGIFSHEVRSAMAGAADVDQNGEVSYDEIRAFISAANGRVRDPKAKLRAFARPPAIHLAEPLFDQRLAKNAPTLRVPTSLAGKYFLQDARGVRFADFHMSPDGPLTLTLVPSSVYFLRNDEEEIQIPFAALQSADASSYERRPTELASRGSESLTFQRDLFAIPFGRAYYEGFRNSLSTPTRTEVRLESQPAFSTTRIVAMGVGGGGLATLAVGIGFGLSASSKASEYRDAIGSNANVDTLREDSESRAHTSNILVAVGGGLIATGVVLWFLE